MPWNAQGTSAAHALLPWSCWLWLPVVCPHNKRRLARSGRGQNGAAQRPESRDQTQPHTGSMRQRVICGHEGDIALQPLGVVCRQACARGGAPFAKAIRMQCRRRTSWERTIRRSATPTATSTAFIRLSSSTARSRPGFAGEGQARVSSLEHGGHHWPPRRRAAQPHGVLTSRPGRNTGWCADAEHGGSAVRCCCFAHPPMRCRM